MAEHILHQPPTVVAEDDSKIVKFSRTVGNMMYMMYISSNYHYGFTLFGSLRHLILGLTIRLDSQMPQDSWESSGVFGASASGFTIYLYMLAVYTAI